MYGSSYLYYLCINDTKARNNSKDGGAGWKKTSNIYSSICCGNHPAIWKSREIAHEQKLCVSELKLVYCLRVTEIDKKRHSSNITLSGPRRKRNNVIHISKNMYVKISWYKSVISISVSAINSKNRTKQRKKKNRNMYILKFKNKKNTSNMESSKVKRNRRYRIKKAT